MTLCPIALAASCKKCPAFSFCPLKSVIGDYKIPSSGKEGKSKADQAPSVEDKSAGTSD